MIMMMMVVVMVVVKVLVVVIVVVVVAAVVVAVPRCSSTSCRGDCERSACGGRSAVKRRRWR